MSSGDTGTVTIGTLNSEQMSEITGEPNEPPRVVIGIENGPNGVAYTAARARELARAILDAAALIDRGIS